ncbi:MAG: hypothetical protein KC572_10650 [Gammaproteobacteria bacterium]|nr:hypothetical protein [Gammaproteobacteria bacterium]
MSTVVDALAPLPDVIEPRWWTGTPALPPESFIIDGSEYGMRNEDLRPESDLAQRMNELFDSTGLVYLTNTRLSDLQTMRAFAKLVVTDEMRYQGGTNPRDDLEANVYEVGAPLQA